MNENKLLSAWTESGNDSVKVNKSFSYELVLTRAG